MVALAGRGWALAPCLRALFDEADRRWPNRSRVSDGSIGDTAHSARASDHNPDSSGDVLAGDLTDDKANGCDADLFAEHLRKARDSRVKYVICNGRVFRSYGPYAWQWTPYDGPNGHFQHTHVSVLDTSAAKYDTSPWFDYADAPDPVKPQPTTTEDFLMALSDAEQKEGLAAWRTTVWPAGTPKEEQHPLYMLVLWTLQNAKETNDKLDALAAEVAALKGDG